MEPFRIAIIAIMAFVILGLAPLFDSGQFILPIGLLKPTFSIILLIGLFIEKKKLKLVEYAALVWAIGFLVTSKFLFDIVFRGSVSKSTLNLYYDFHAFVTLISYIALLLWMLLLAWKEKNNSWSIIQAIGAVGMFASLMMNELLWLLPLVIVWYLGIHFQKKKGTVHKALALFLFFTVVATWLSAYFFGHDAILLQL